MSYPFKRFPLPRKNSGRQFFSFSIHLGLATLALAAIPSRAESASYGHAEISVGTPNVQVTVGKTWEDNDEVQNEEIVEEEAPAEVEDESYDGRDDYVAEKRIIIRNQSHCGPRERVVVINRNDNCRRDVIVRRVVVRPRCDRRVVIIHPRRRVVIIGRDDRYDDYRWNHPRDGRHYGDGKWDQLYNDRDGHDRFNNHRDGQNQGDGKHDQFNNHQDDHNSRDLFDHSNKRDSRDRGVQRKSSPAT